MKRSKCADIAFAALSASSALFSAVLPTAAEAQTSIARNALAIDLNTVVRQETRIANPARQSVMALSSPQRTVATPGWLFAGTVGLDGSRSRGGTNTLATPVALGWESAVGQGSIAMALETDGWVRVSNGDTASGLADVVASIAGAHSMGKDLMAQLKLSALLPTRGEVGSRKPSAGVEARLRGSPSTDTTLITVWGVTGNGDWVSEAGATTQSLSLIALHPFGPGVVVGALSRSLPRTGAGSTSWLVKWVAQIAPGTSASARAVGVRGDGPIFSTFGIAAEWDW